MRHKITGENAGNFIAPKESAEPMWTIFSWYHKSRYVKNAGMIERQKLISPKIPVINPRNIVVGIVPSIKTFTGSETSESIPVL